MVFKSHLLCCERAASLISLLFFTLFVSACGGGGSSSGADAVDPNNSDETIIGLPKPVPYGNGPATILEGTWVTDCVILRVGTSIVGYGKSVRIYTGNGVSIVGNTFSDSNCVTLVSSSTSKKDIIIGNQITSDSGLASYPIDITTVQGTTTLPNGSTFEDIAGITNYAITRVDADKMYDARAPDPLLFDPMTTPPGSTPSSRITTLNFDYFHSRF